MIEIEYSAAYYIMFVLIVYVVNGAVARNLHQSVSVNSKSSPTGVD